MSDIHTNLATHLNMLDELWERFVQHGVTDETKIILEFIYNCPDETSARNLSKDLIVYGAEIHREDPPHNNWFISGETSPMNVSKKMLYQWTTLMVTKGWEYDCEFDGFEAQMP